MDDNAFGIAKAEMRLTIPETAVLEVVTFFCILLFLKQQLQRSDRIGRKIFVVI
jgi:hypothetical protein